MSKPGYNSLFRARIADHTVAPLPEAVRADFEATFYDQTWRSARAAADDVVTFRVLALGPIHALEVGARQLEVMYGRDTSWTLVKSEVVEFTSERLIEQLTTETAEVKAERREWYARGAP